MDERYRPLVQYVAQRFTDHLGPRLQSVFVKGSVARGDAVWGVSDLDLVLAFECPSPDDTDLKRAVEVAARAFGAGEALVIQRIGADRLRQMDAGTWAYWLYSCRHDVAVVAGQAPTVFLPPPPRGEELASLIAPIIHHDGMALVTKRSLGRQESRRLAKHILQALALPAVVAGHADYVAPLAVPTLPLPAAVRGMLAKVVAAYTRAPALADSTALTEAWSATWAFLRDHGIEAGGGSAQ